LCGMQLRFEAIVDIVDRWTVWDWAADCPASFGGEILIGLSLSSATQLAEILNSLYRICAEPCTGFSDGRANAWHQFPIMSGFRRGI
jgi:hypothetical protein